MAWWHWVLIGVAVLLLGWIKLLIFKRMKQHKTEKRIFTDEE